MKIGLNPGSIMDTDGTPLVGRVSVLVHDSTQYVDVYTMNGSAYVQSANPVLLDAAGRIPDTLFFDAQVVDVLVQRYIGAPGQMSQGSPDADFEDFDRFEAGFDFDPSTAAGDAVDTIADLRTRTNRSGVVMVRSYRTLGDCAPRFYVWDANCNAPEDNGFVIRSIGDANGKWVLLWNDESIPSSVYGIKAGTYEGNIGDFVGLAQTIVGSVTYKTPTSIYFEGGTYTTASYFTCAQGRKVVFANNAKFTGATFVLGDLDVDGYNADYIADFTISRGTNNGVRVKSSWFRTATAFWGCGASEHVVELTNFFTSSEIGSTVTCNGVVYGDNSLLNMSFNGGHIDFTDCTFVGERIFDGGLEAKFTRTNFSDKLFDNITATADFGAISGGHALEVDTWQITDARDANCWVKWAAAVNMSMINLQGRTIADIDNSNFSSIYNGVVAGQISTNVDLALIDISGAVSVEAKTSGLTLSALRCQEVYVNDGAYRFAAISARDCYMHASPLYPASTAYEQNGGKFTGVFRCDSWDATSGNPAECYAVKFENVEMDIGYTSWLSNITARNCTILRPVHVIPYHDGTNLVLDVEFSGCTFAENGIVAFGDSSVGNADIYDVHVTRLIIKDCIFEGFDAKGIHMPFYSNNGAQKFLAALQDVSAIYENNAGKCPREDYEEATFTMQDVYTETDYTGYRNSSAVRRMWNLSNYDVFAHGSMLGTLGGSSSFGTPYYLHDAAIVANNDQFAVHLAIDAGDYTAQSVTKIFNK